MASREALIDSLDHAIILLRERGREHWVTWLERDRRLIEGGDFFGVEHLLSAFGGMGSLSEESMAPSSPGNSVLTTSNRLAEVLESIYSLATELKREEDRREAI